MERNPLNLINDLLHLGLDVTVLGDELKGYCPDSEGPGLTSFYLNEEECRALGNAFLRAAELFLAATPRSKTSDDLHREHCGPACPRHQGTGPCDMTSVQSPP